MERAEKEKFVRDLKESLQSAKIAVLTQFEGMTVAQMTELRRNLLQKNSKYKVVKNTLARIAVKGTPFEGAADRFVRTVGIAYSKTDPVGPIKVITDYLKKDEESKLKVVVAHMDGKALSANEFKALATLPSREEMLSKMLGSMKAPAQNMANVLAAVPRQLATVLAAIRDQKEKT